MKLGVPSCVAKLTRSGHPAGSRFSLETPGHTKEEEEEYE